MLRKLMFITAILLFPELASAQFTYYLPHVVNGSIPGTADRYRTEIYITNPSTTASVDITVNLYNKNGAPLAAFADTRFVPFSTWSFTLGPRALGQLPTTAFATAEGGWAKIEATGQLNVSTILEESTPTVPKARVSLPTTAPLVHFSAPVFVNSLGGSVGVALLNPSSNAAGINIQLFSETGLVATRTVALPPQHNIAAFLDSDEYFGNMLPGFGNGPVFHGVMEVTSSVPISVTLVWVKDGTWLYWPVFNP